MRRAAAAAVLATVLAAGPATASPQWTSPTRLSAATRALGPELAVSPSGRALVVWDREEGADCATSPASLACVHVVTARSRASQWNGELEVNRPGVGAEPRAAVNDAGNEALIWVHDIGADRVVQATYRRSPSDAFPEPNDLSGVVRRVTSHAIALDRDGDAVAVWTERYADGTSAVRAATRSAFYGVWSGVATLSAPAAAISAGPHLAVTASGSAYAVWIENGRVRLAHGWAWGLTGAWEPSETVSAVGGEAAGDVALAASDVALSQAPQDGLATLWVWRDSPQGAWRVQALRRPGGFLLPPVDLERVADPQAAEPQLALDQRQGIVAVWADGSPAARLRSAVLRPASGSWSAASTVAEHVAEPRLALDEAADAVAIWTTSAGAVQAAARPFAAGAWQPPVTLVPSGGSHVRIGLDASARATAVWNRDAPQGVAVESSDLSGVGEISLVNVRRPAIRGVARVGHTLTCNRGAWEGTVPIRYRYAWLRSGRVATRATRSTRRAGKGDLGSRLACRVTATNAARSLSVTSAPVRVRK